MISVVIPTYNEEANIERSLRQFDDQTIGRKNIELIVVDGGSKDRTRDIAKKYADKVILQKSKGVGGARNDGVAMAKHGLIATTDADTSVPTDWLERIVKNFEDEKIALVFGPVVPDKKSLKFRITFGLDKYGSWLLSRANILHRAYGCNCAFKKSTFVKIGGYSDIPILDDFEIGMRIKKEGKIHFDRNLWVIFSTRRLVRDGCLKPGILWTKNYVKLMLGLPINANYAKQEYGA
jgi:glycosyltransferase involved in cell wall biosynthesis